MRQSLLKQLGPAEMVAKQLLQHSDLADLHDGG
jgi:hypothetical protein